MSSITLGRNRISDQHCRPIRLALNAIIMVNEKQGELLMCKTDNNQFLGLKLEGGQVVHYGEEVATVVLNQNQVNAIKLVVKKCIEEDHYRS